MSEYLIKLRCYVDKRFLIGLQGIDIGVMSSPSHLTAKLFHILHHTAIKKSVNSLYHTILHLLPALPEAQKEALRSGAEIFLFKLINVCLKKRDLHVCIPSLPESAGYIADLFSPLPVLRREALF